MLIWSRQGNWIGREWVWRTPTEPCVLQRKSVVHKSFGEEQVVGNRQEGNVSEKLKSLNILKFGKVGIRLFVDLFHRMKDSKDFGFQDQIQGDVVSIPSRVTEGYHS